MLRIVKILVSISFLLLSSGFYAQPFTELQKIDASDRAASDNFGAVAISGNYAIVGAPNEDHDALGGNPLSSAGAAYIFERQSSGNWVEVQKIVAGDREMGSEFGGYVDIDGNYVIIGAKFESKDANGLNPIAPYAGAAYIFERQSGGTWVQVQKIVASDRKANQDFGIRVAIDGGYAVVGASGETTDVSGLNPYYGAGAAYVFELSGATWNQVAKIVAPDRNNGNDATFGNRFGCSVEIDGNYLVVGARYDNMNASGTPTGLTGAGSAYIFERIASSWTFVQKVVAVDRATNDAFGEAVNINDTTIVVGALQSNLDAAGLNPLNDAGSAYIYERNAGGTWNYKQKLVAFDRATGNDFGDEVAIDGNHILIGAWHDTRDENSLNPLLDAGSGYIYQKNTTTGVWSLMKKIDASDRGVDDLFTSTIGISGNYIIVGAMVDDEDENTLNPLTDAGSAYIFGPFNCNTYDTISITACDSLVSPSGRYTWYTSGTYNDTIPNGVACDSIITINLTINNSSFSSISVTACDSLVSPSGLYTWYTSGVYRDTLVNAVGCDSIITITLTINNSSVTNISLTACDSLVSPSGLYTWYTSGVYRDTLLSSNGCDSILVISLTINYATSSSISVTACDSLVSPSGLYTWYGSGTYSDTIPNSNGCDSVITINLTINNASYSTINLTACDSLISPSGLFTWYSSGTYNDTLVNAVGCDSILTINLTISTEIQITINDSICDSVLSPSGAQWWFSPGIYYDTVFSLVACDTVYTVVLDEYCPLQIKIPQFYSPNGDDQNDKWEIENITEYQNYVKIFNRWGNVVYEMKNYDNSWEGQCNTGLSYTKDGILPTGTYFYVVEIETTEHKQFTGYLYLRR